MLYFGRAKRLLTDAFEVCSFHGLQTLILLSLYCQYALKPHTSYMYSGMAIRTALGIGLSQAPIVENNANQMHARQTLLASYCQDVEVSCAAGRLTTAFEPPAATTANTENRLEETLDMSEDGCASRAIVLELVRLSKILDQALRGIYCDARVNSMAEKNELACNLSAALEVWKNGLPGYLKWDRSSFSDPEWASKQKLLLKLRYYSAKLTVHRPFITKDAAATSIEHESHSKICFGAAKSIINHMHQAFTDRHYFRTWWYNATYALSAGVVLLHLFLQDWTSDPDVLLYVQQALQLLESMDTLLVARRSATLLREIHQLASSRASSAPSGTQDDYAAMLEQTGSYIAADDQLDNLLSGLMVPNMIEGFTAAVGEHHSFLDLPYDMFTNGTFPGDYNFIAGEQADVGNMTRFPTLHE